MKYDLIVVGAGASGLTAAITFKRQQANRTVLVLEKNSRACKKVSASGNGQGNVANSKISLKNYHTESPNELEQIFKHGDCPLDFLRSIGLVLRQDGDKYFPYSYQATAVTDALLLECARLGIEIKTDCEVKEIAPSSTGYTVSANAVYTASFVVFSVGGIAWRGARSYPLLERLGHSITSVYPSLVQLRADVSRFKGLRGVKVNAGIRVDKAYSEGDVLFTEYGLSGNAVFAVSPYVSRLLGKQGKVSASLDFMPNLSLEQAENYLMHARSNGENPLLGVFHKHLSQSLMRIADIQRVTKDNAKELASVVKNCPITILGTNGFDNAQVTIGGFKLTEFHSNLMSKLYSGLFCTGEALDVDGDCGGFNLYFAWLSGLIAGSSAGELCE